MSSTPFAQLPLEHDARAGRDGLRAGPNNRRQVRRHYRTPAEPCEVAARLDDGQRIPQRCVGLRSPVGILAMRSTRRETTGSRASATRPSSNSTTDYTRLRRGPTAVMVDKNATEMPRLLRHHAENVDSKQPPVSKRYRSRALSAKVSSPTYRPPTRATGNRSPREREQNLVGTMVFSYGRIPRVAGRARCTFVCPPASAFASRQPTTVRT